jgi:hypothetical protein
MTLEAAPVLLAAIMGLLAPPDPAQTPSSESPVCRAAGGLSRLPALPEASGMAVSRRSAGLLWSINDSGEPMVFALTDRGELLGRTRVSGAAVDDWEDISVAGCPRGSCLYIADIGDNRAQRKHVTIYRVPEPDPKAEATDAAEALRVTYPDGPHDAEGLFVTSAGELFVVTKGETGPLALYRVPGGFRPGATVQLERVWSLKVSGSDGNRGARVTDVESSPDGRWVVMRTTTAVLFYRPAELVSEAPRERHRIDVTGLREPQGEGVAIGSGGVVYLAGEGGMGGGTFVRLNCML